MYVYKEISASSLVSFPHLCANKSKLVTCKSNQYQLHAGNSPTATSQAHEHRWISSYLLHPQEGPDIRLVFVEAITSIKWIYIALTVCS